ncbi:ribose 5-phosphate isomerase A [Sporosarcina sp. P26b]|uniref:ribose 5-phosphate isomerase A n=1 Tax=Sporosarcina TaxID=1569 RepID=UPI000A17C851|nr:MULTISPECIES: ribose 5-phosphate isomerase A [Sporosarcina]ARK22027.1 hypothetical protein SporoP32a_11155 [Sporosarcina ureae]PIC96339.1 ribose 5-phosphate isomerase A [Sporosarcina sp. P26b]PIC98573.1 ribose 5-phosphate isomerase A [Sporosarcina sp. P29]PID06000.1 ribose 5-phosphate isomerase A [Sporosarcina sp. P30]PID09194.1 ribose 5-phosphate isomerase A [Sporosarcina sp. P31]
MVSPYEKNINNEEKNALANLAVSLVENKTVIGLGSGSTIGFFLEHLALRMKEEKLELKFIASSNKIAKQAKKLNLQLIEIEDVPFIDQAFDGADRVDLNSNLIKGGGGSLFRERQVLLKAEQRYILADSSKFTNSLLGQIIPLEIVPFNASFTIKRIESLGYKIALRKDGDNNFITDNGNWIVDVSKQKSVSPADIYEQLKLISGVVEIGLFLNEDYHILKT